MVTRQRQMKKERKEKSINTYVFHDIGDGVDENIRALDAVIQQLLQQSFAYKEEKQSDTVSFVRKGMSGI